MTQEGKKDVLDFPLEEVEVPPAIVLMMQAATKCVSIEENEAWRDEFKLITDNERLQLLAEKLEARVEDAIEKASKVREDATDEDEPNRYENAEESETTLVYYENEVHQIVHGGVVFGKFCNEPVATDQTSGARTSCIKQWAHKNPEHEDAEGNIR